MQASRPPVALHWGRRRHPFSPFGCGRQYQYSWGWSGIPNTKDLKTEREGVGRLGSSPTRCHMGRQRRPGLHTRHCRAHRRPENFSPYLSKPVLLMWVYKPTCQHYKSDQVCKQTTPKEVYQTKASTSGRKLETGLPLPCAPLPPHTTLSRVAHPESVATKSCIKPKYVIHILNKSVAVKKYSLPVCIHHSSGFGQFRDPECCLIHPVLSGMCSQPPKHGHGHTTSSENVSKASACQPATSLLKSIGLRPTYRGTAPIQFQYRPSTQLHINLQLTMPLPAWTSVRAFCFFPKPQPFQGYPAQGPHSAANSIHNANSQRREPCSTHA